MDTGASSSDLEGAVGAYDRESVERFLAAATAERERVLSALEDARRRRQRAESAALEGSLDERLRATVLAATRAIATERAATELEVERMITEAELRAAELVAVARAEAQVLAQRGAPSDDALDAEFHAFGRRIEVGA